MGLTRWGGGGEDVFAPEKRKRSMCKEKSGNPCGVYILSAFILNGDSCSGGKGMLMEVGLTIRLLWLELYVKGEWGR